MQTDLLLIPLFVIGVGIIWLISPVILARVFDSRDVCPGDGVLR